MFGAWHILPSSALTNGNFAVHEWLGGSAVLVAVLPVASTMLVGIVLSFTCFVGKGLKSSMLVHWATNSLGFVAAWLVAH